MARSIEHQQVELDPMENSARRALRTRPSGVSGPVGWTQQAPPLETGVLAIDGDLRVLLDIIFCLDYFDLWILRCSVDAPGHRDFSLFDRQDQENILTLIRPELAEIYKRDYLLGHVAQQLKMKRLNAGLTSDQAIQRIQNLELVDYLSLLFKQKVNILSIYEIKSDNIANSTTFAVPLQELETFGERYTWQEYVIQNAQDLRMARVELETIHDLAIRLRDSIPEAVSQGLLDERTLESLKEKMHALNNNFGTACVNLLKKRQELLWETQSSWWIKGPRDDLQEGEPKKVAYAYEHSPGLNSTLSFVVPALSLLSGIPAVMAWTHSSRSRGSIADADFYQLISSSSMQLLSILTLVVPMVSNARLIRMAWFWTLFSASLSAVCSVIAVPLYLFTPTKWSAMLAFIASVVQALVILQLVFVL